MIANIISGGILCLCIVSAITYILRQRKLAIKNNNPVCIGCPGAARCSSHCHCSSNGKKND